MKKLMIATMVMVSLVGNLLAFDLVEVDMLPNLMVWWIHNQDSVQTQVYGVPGQWVVCAAGPIFSIPKTKLSLQIPAGVNLGVSNPTLPLTHWVAKINMIGGIGPCQFTSINDKSWGRGPNPHLFFFKDVISYKWGGIRVEGFKVGSSPLPVVLGPMYIYDFGQNTFQVFAGVNLRKTGERCLKFEYLYKKF